MANGERGLIRKYLLGELPEDAAEGIEARLVSEAGFLLEVEDVEDELVEAFLRGELADDEAARFTRRAESVPVLRASVERARVIRDGLTPAARGRATALRPWWGWYVRVSGVRLAMAAGLLAAIGAMVVLRTEPDGPRIAGGDRPGATHPSPEVPASDRPAEPGPRESTGPRGEGPGGGAGEIRPSPGRRGAIVSLALLAGQTMGERASATAVLGPEVAALRLALILDESPDRRPAAELVSDEGRVIWRSSKLSVDAGTGGPAVRVDLPSALLVRGAYRLVLTGDVETGARETLGTYYFTVERP